MLHLPCDLLMSSTRDKGLNLPVVTFWVLVFSAAEYIVICFNGNILKFVSGVSYCQLHRLGWNPGKAGV